jgi:phosphate transport system substrate-binding protein
MSHDRFIPGAECIERKSGEMTHHSCIRSVFGLMVAAFGMLGGCSGSHGDVQGRGDRATSAAGRQTLTIKGSDTMVILAQRWAQAFMDQDHAVAVQVSGGGSGTGIAALINGTTDLANASRPMTDREEAQVHESRGADPRETPVALDALAVYVQKDNPIETLTLAQLKGIFRGQITRWSELGGPDRPIILYSRENNSGTYAYFKEHVLEDEDFATTAQTLPGTAAVINAVSRDVNGIGYGGIAYAEGVRTVPVSREGEAPVEPTMANATSGRYPLARYLYVYTAGAPSGLAARYIEFVRSPEGQRIVEGVGYYPLPAPSAAEATTANSH